MRSLTKCLVFACAATLSGLLAFSMSSFGAKGGIPGPPTGGEVGNNLSLPAVLTGSAITTDHNWIPPAEPVLGVHYSYGCDQPESDGQFNYPADIILDANGRMYIADRENNRIQVWSY